MPQLYKFLRTGMKSEYGTCKWTLGKWKKEDTAKACDTGFHGSEKILDALSYVKGEILAIAEVRGECDLEKDKQAWTEMRIIQAYKWTKEESVKLAVFSAELVIGIYEKEYPDDKRPREAIEAAKAWIENPTKDAAARAAYAADAARAAAYAADAADAARAAARAAYAAYAAYAARAAARAAYAARAADAAYAAYAADAADAAARAARAVLDKIEAYLLSRIPHLEKVCSPQKKSKSSPRTK